MDKRWQKLGDILVEYSTKVQPGERVMIAMTEQETLPLAQAVYRAVIRRGGYPQIQYLSEVLRRYVLAEGNDDQVSWVPEVEQWGMDWADVYIGLRGARNLHELDDIDPSRLAANQTAMGIISTKRWQQTRWCLVRVPNESFAQQARSNYEYIEEMFFNSCFLDWEKEASLWDRWSEQLGAGKQVRIIAKDTDLSFSVEGRTWVPFAGKNNMPDGEIATAPVTSTIDGTITFERPGVLGGRLIEDISLTWEQGVLKKWSCSTEQEFFNSIITRDSGSSLIGEFAFGTNSGVTTFCNDILIDEKIEGTIHIALGRAYPECGGTNESAIHWDIVKDIRREGAVYLDGKEIVKEGRILL